MPLPDGLLLAAYGDDFTGSTDVMEVMARAGLPAVLFLIPPTPEGLARFPQARAVIVAGHSRTMTPARMDAGLPPIYEALKALGAPVVHSKICSTFDSSPEIGSIGRTIEIGRRVFGDMAVPVVVGAPALNRFVAFGNLFARSGPESEVFRLDRHPTMSRHPVTPMHESDIHRLLIEQSPDMITAGMDVPRLDGGADEAHSWLRALEGGGADAIVFDTLTEAHLETIGGLLWKKARDGGLFSVSSSGLEYALTAHWRAQGWLPEPPTFSVDPVEQIVVVSGSCSPVTARQIDHAVKESGFAEIALDAAELLEDYEAMASPEIPMDELLKVLFRVEEDALNLVKSGKSIVLHIAKGPDDPRMAEVRTRFGENRHTSFALGNILGLLLKGLIRAGVRRAIVCGGDTSSRVALTLRIKALEMAAPFAPGSPLCRVIADRPPKFAELGDINGAEILFKGGQVGWIDLFERVRTGQTGA